MHDDDLSRRSIPYDPPAVAWEETFDSPATLAAACAKIGGQSATCDTSPAS